MDFLVKRDDLERCRFAEAPLPDLEPGQALLDVSAFGLTSNNITYAVYGEAMSYWDFFPAEPGWGRIPVWGFADVATSRHEDLGVGTRVFGYLPMSSHLVVTPEPVDEGGFTDAAPHRSGLPSIYNVYMRVDADPAYEARYEDQRMLLRPLFGTSFLIDDFLADNGFFGASTVVLSSASSKTALGTAFLVSRREGIEVIGLTSPGNLAFVEGVGTYDRVVAYEAIGSLPTARAVYVDMAGDAAVRGAVHLHYGDQLAHDAAVGDTHWDSPGGAPADLPGPQPALFFAPDQLSKRRREWGEEGFARLGEAWRPFVEWTDGWLEIVHGGGPETIESAYLELLAGRVSPSVGYVLSMEEATEG
jgi:hypothetical protein